VAVRAPNIGELFAPSQLGYTYVDDPCDTRFIKQGTQYRAANCKTLLNNLLGPGGFNQVKNNLEPDQTIPAYTEGNPALQPETARTLTLGTVIQPDFLSDLVVTVDWYRINIANAITPPSTQDVADQCVDLSTLNNPFCKEITRATTGKFVGQISQITSQELNLASYFTQGEDFTVSYHANMDDWFGSHVGMLDLHLMGNHTDMISFVALPGEAAVNSMNLATGGADYGPTPYWHLNLDAVWTHDAWTLDYNVDWFNSVYNPYLTERSQPVGQPNILAHQYLYAPAYDVHSIQLGYDIREGWNVYAGVNNLWYQKPSVGNTGFPVDPLGRFFYAGVKIDINPF
jgi:iron complex outermembrane receptor protein